MGKFQYKARTVDQVEKRANQQGGDYVGIIKDEYRVYTMKKGLNYIRFFPPTWEDAQHFGYDVWVHFGVGPERGAVLCIAKMKGVACPLCEARTKLERDGEQKAADELKPARRVAAWVLDRQDTAKVEEPLVIVMAWTVDRDIVKICQDPRSREIYLIDHPDEGYDVSFEKTGDQLTTKYVGFQLARRPSSVSEAAMEYVQNHPITDTFLWRNYDEIQAVYEGIAAGNAAWAEKKKDQSPTRNEREMESTRQPERTLRQEVDDAESRAIQTRSTGRARIAEPDPEPPPSIPTQPAGDAKADRLAALRARFAEKSK